MNSYQYSITELTVRFDDPQGVLTTDELAWMCQFLIDHRQLATKPAPYQLITNYLVGQGLVSYPAPPKPPRKWYNTPTAFWVSFLVTIALFFIVPHIIMAVTAP